MKLRIKYIIPIFLCLILNSACSMQKQSSDSVWSQMAMADLQTTESIIAQNSQKAKGDQNHYQQWLAEGYTQAKEMALQVNSFPGYLSVMQYYLVGFRDFHTSMVPLLKMVNPSWKWPGFTVGKRGGQVVVIWRDTDDFDPATLPALGSALASCDGQTVDQMIKNRLVPYYPVETNYPSTETRFIPDLMVYRQNPFLPKLDSCVFNHSGQSQTVKLAWQVVKNSSPLTLGVEGFDGKLQAAAFGPTPKFGIETFGSDSVWVPIPIFAWGLRAQGTITTTFLNQIINSVASYRDKKLIVFDLRGNTGGDPAYMRPIILNLFGAPFLRSLRSKFMWNNPSKTLYAATQSNLGHMIASHSPQEMIEGMKQAIAEGKPTYLYQTTVLPSGPVNAENLVSAKIVLLTDGRCASECNSFVAAMKQLPNVIQVGQPTGPQTNSTWNNVKVFDDNAGAMVYPTGVILSPAVTDGAPIMPQKTYTGDMGDTVKLKAWILSLFPALKA